MRFKVWLLWHVLIPAFTKMLGYFPAKKLGLFEDLPGQAALQWARWGKNKNYMFDELPKKKEQFEMLSKPALVFSFSDDPIAPSDAVKDLLHYYSNLDIEHHHLEPSDIGRKHIGHFNFFRKEFRDPFWSSVSQWLLERTVFTREHSQHPRKAVKQTSPHALHITARKVS
jgi:predicted alpha/beta hydrolase